MASSRFLACIFLLITNVALHAQTLYVDGIHGRDDAAGTQIAPLASLGKAVDKANKSSGNEPIAIMLAPGLYSFVNPLVIRQAGGERAEKYIFEAVVLPDDPNWTPDKMPVIQCVADSNRVGKLKHASTAFQIEQSNVVIKGLKFIGNPNPASLYYYPIQRKDSTLNGLEVSQCYFIGEKNSAPIQGGLFVQGAGVSVDHCVFYGAKNAVMIFSGIKNFSLTHTIIYGAYEGAVWYGYGQSSDMPFVFNDNIIAGGNYFWVGYRGIHRNYKFSNSLITGNAKYMGFNEEEIIPDEKNKPEEKNIVKSGRVFLNEAQIQGIPKDHLNLLPSSAGQNIDAGIFIKAKK